MPNYYAITDSYLQNGFKNDLEKYFGFATTGGFRHIASVQRPLTYETERLIAIEEPELFASLVYHLAFAEFTLADGGHMDILRDFLRVSGWPLLFLPFGRRKDPMELLLRAGLPDIRSLTHLAEYASEIIYKELEHTLGGQVRTRESAAVAAAMARLKGLDKEAKKELLDRYADFSHQFTHDTSAPSHPEVNLIRGSILGGDRYGLDGVVIFKRLSFNGLRAVTEKCVSRLEELEVDGPVSVYRASKGTLRRIIVYSYKYHHSYDEAIEAFKTVLAVAERHGVKRLGMNGLELTEEALRGETEGRAMVRMVTGVADHKSLDELWFIDPHGAFNK